MKTPQLACHAKDLCRALPSHACWCTNSCRVAAVQCQRGRCPCKVTACHLTSSILQALHITCKAATVHYPCTSPYQANRSPASSQLQSQSHRKQPSAQALVSNLTPNQSHQPVLLNWTMRKQMQHNYRAYCILPMCSCTLAKLQQCHSTAHCNTHPLRWYP